MPRAYRCAGHVSPPPHSGRSVSLLGEDPGSERQDGEEKPCAAEREVARHARALTCWGNILTQVLGRDIRRLVEGPLFSEHAPCLVQGSIWPESRGRRFYLVHFSTPFALHADR